MREEAPQCRGRLQQPGHQTNAGAGSAKNRGAFGMLERSRSFEKDLSAELIR